MTHPTPPQGADCPNRPNDEATCPTPSKDFTGPLTSGNLALVPDVPGVPGFEDNTDSYGEDTSSPSAHTDHDELLPIAALPGHLKELDEITHHKCVYQHIRLLPGRGVEVAEAYRGILVGGKHIGARPFTQALAEAKQAHKNAAQAERRTAAADREDEGADYEEIGGRTYTYDMFGNQVLLAAFTARIDAEITRDDGAEVFKLTRIVVTAPNGRSGTVEVPAADLTKAGKWAADAIGGASAIIKPLSRAEHHVLTAAQLNSIGKFSEETVYAHTGWKAIDGRNVFLSPAGALGADGLDTGITVDLGNDRLNMYRCVDPSHVDRRDLVEAVRQSLDILNVAPARVTAPALAAVYRAPLPKPPVTSVFLSGQSGSLKSALTGPLTQHFGAGFHGESLPDSWVTTGNALEVRAHALANVLFTIDEFSPQAREDTRQLVDAADRVFRGSANGSGRGRLRPDGTPRPTRFPRAQIMSSGEDVPPGQSLRARLTLVEVARGDVDPKKLAVAQRRALAGMYELAMSGYIRWIAGKLDADESYVDGLHAKAMELRDAFSATGGHLRGPNAIADLYLGWLKWLEFAEEIGAIDQARHVELQGIASVALADGSVSQREHTSQQSPTRVFLDSLRGALTSGRAHIAGCEDGRDPRCHPSISLVRLGWKQRKNNDGDCIGWESRGDCIGWIPKDGSVVYLDPTSSHATATAEAKRGSQRFNTSNAAVGRQLESEGHLLAVDEGRPVKKASINGGRPRVYHLKPEALGLDSDPDQKPSPEPETQDWPDQEPPEDPDGLWEGDDAP